MTTSLHNAIKQGNLEQVQIHLKKANVNAGMDDITKRTPLHYAVLFLGADKVDKCIEIMNELINSGAKVDTIDFEGQTPLHYAAEHSDDSDVVKELLNKNADVNIIDKQGKTPLHYATEECKTEVVKELLVANADMNIADKQDKTPLHYATENCKVKIINYLLEKKVAKTDLIDKFGKTPLNYAHKRGSKRIIDLFNSYTESGTKSSSSRRYTSIPLTKKKIVKPKPKPTIKRKIYRTKTGARYVVRVSKITGKKYKQYLPRAKPKTRTRLR